MRAVLIGTRTTRQMVEQGTNMVGLVRWANVLVGKLIEAGVPKEPALSALEGLALEVVSFDAAMAVEAGVLRRDLFGLVQKLMDCGLLKVADE